MELVIITEDKMVQLDGESINFDFTISDNIWAVHWDGVSGTVEYNDGTNPTEITDISNYQSVVDAFNAEKQRIIDATTQEEADRVANMTYAEKREEAYPSKNEQLDMQFHDAVDGTTTWVDAIKAIKDAHPKT